MQTFNLQTPRGALFSLIGAAATSVCVLGSTLMLFEQAGRTPVFEPGSRLALQAAQCPTPLSQPARRTCLRDIAASAAAAHHDALLAARSADTTSLR